MNISVPPKPQGTPPRSQNGVLARLRLIGQMEAWTLTSESVLPAGRKTRALLAIVALGAPRPVLRSRLAEMLWSRRSEEQARASLRQEIHRLLEALGLARGDGRYARMLKSFARVQLLILDDWAITPLTAEQRRYLIEIVDDRHDRGVAAAARAGEDDPEVAERLERLVVELPRPAVRSASAAATRWRRCSSAADSA